MINIWLSLCGWIDHVGFCKTKVSRYEQASRSKQNATSGRFDRSINAALGLPAAERTAIARIVGADITGQFENMQFSFGDAALNLLSSPQTNKTRRPSPCR